MFKLCSPDSRSRACQLFWKATCCRIRIKTCCRSQFWDRGCLVATPALHVQPRQFSLHPHRTASCSWQKSKNIQNRKSEIKKTACSASVVQSPPTPPLIQTFYRTKVRKQNKIIKKMQKIACSALVVQSPPTPPLVQTPQTFHGKKRNKKILQMQKKSECSALVVRYPPTPPPVLSFC